MALPFLLQQQSAEKRLLGQAEGQDFAQLLRIRLQALTSPQERGQELPLIDSLLPPFINIWPSNTAIWESASPLRRMESPAWMFRRRQ